MLAVVNGFIRLFAILLGCFILGSFTIDLLGLGYYSTDPPPLRIRFGKWLVAMPAGLALVVPYGWLRSHRALWFSVAGVLMLLVVWTISREVATIRQYAAGQISWEGVVISLCVGVVVLANLLVFLSTRRTPSVSGCK